MRKTFRGLLAVALALGCVPGLADKADGDLWTFCPFMCTGVYNMMLKNFLDGDETKTALLQVTSDGMKNGALTYSNLTQDTFFLFGGVSNEYETGTSAYIYCSLKEDSTLKNIPMLIWATCIEMGYNGKVEETGSSFLEWVNNPDTKDGDLYTSPYFIALYSEEHYDHCTLLLTMR